MSSIKTILMLIIMSCFIASCSTTLPSHYPEKYYKQNEAAIIGIESNYSNIYRQKPLVIAFADNGFQYVTVEMKTDSLRYVYEFKVAEKRLADTLQKFGFDVNAVLKLIKDMQRIKCTWINRLEYYVDDKKQKLILLSIRPKVFDVMFSGKKYYTLTFYS